MYELLKALHVSCVLASGAGVLARGALMLAGSRLIQVNAARSR